MSKRLVVSLVAVTMAGMFSPRLDAQDEKWNNIPPTRAAYRDKKPSGTAIGDTIDWNKALPAAKPLLSPAQHTLLQAFATHRSTERLIDEQVRRLGRRPK